jgi:phosphoglycolate phosphatase
MILVLFDIDGTLLLTGRLGQKSAKIALERVFGTSGRLDDFYPGGRTIEGIFVDTLADAGFKPELYLEKRDQLYEVFFNEFGTRLDRGEHQIRPLSGTIELIKYLNRQDDILLGLVTGNHRYTAELKLKTAGIEPAMFKVGAFGNESAERSELISLAQNRAYALTGEDYSGDNTIVLGDTTRDVLSAKLCGARSIAVTTGTDGRELLESVHPDLLVDDLSNLELVVVGIFGS